MSGGKIEPGGDRILVRPMGETQVNGVLVTEAVLAQDPVRQATVLAVGPGVVNHQGTPIPKKTKVDDEILYDTRQGLELRVGNKVLLFLHDSMVIAYVRAPNLVEA